MGKLLLDRQMLAGVVDRCEIVLVGASYNSDGQKFLDSIVSRTCVYIIYILFTSSCSALPCPPAYSTLKLGTTTSCQQRIAEIPSKVIVGVSGGMWMLSKAAYGTCSCKDISSVAG